MDPTMVRVGIAWMLANLAGAAWVGLMYTLEARYSTMQRRKAARGALRA